MQKESRVKSEKLEKIKENKYTILCYDILKMIIISKNRIGMGDTYL